MPKLQDKEIQDLLRAVNEGLVLKNFGYQHCCDVVPSLKKACRSNEYRVLFSNWWCKYKQRNAHTFKEAPPAGESAPVPPLTEAQTAALERASEPKPIAEKDKPPKKKGPKRKVPNNIYVSPFPSPTNDVNDVILEEEIVEEYDFNNDLFMPTPKKTSTTKPPPESDQKPAAVPAEKTKPETPKKHPATKTASPEAIIMSEHMLPEDVARKLIEASKDPPSTFSLNLGAPHGIDMHKVAHPCAKTGIMCITYFIKGASEAELLPGGKKIHVRFDRDPRMVAAIPQIMRNTPYFAAKLTNGDVNKEFEAMESMLNHMVTYKTLPNSVSLLRFLVGVFGNSTHAILFYCSKPA